MNPVAEELLSYLGFENEEEYLEHYGMPRRSGRYPWGSGDDPYQHGSRDFLSRIEELKKTGWTETPENIEKEFGITTTQYRLEKACCTDERRLLKVDRAKSLAADGLTPTQIGKEMGMNESSVRALLKEESEARSRAAQNAANFIKSQVDKNGGQMVDVGKGADLELRISKEKLEQALYLLESEGYPIYKGGIPQPNNPGQQTNQKVICPPGTQYKDIYKFDQIHPLNEDNYISRDGGDTFEKKFHYPESMDSKRLQIRYAEDGGIDKDGIVELRRGVEDLSLGESRYSQVRILVDKTHYIKGMAVYSDDMPPGVDVVFNTNKKKNVDKMDVLKPIHDDPDNPFGSLIKDAEQGGQYWYTDSKTGKKKLGLINKRADEGDWDDWSNALPSQFLGKQPKALAKKQLDLAKADKMAEYDEIMSLTNPTIKKYYLNKFADECDAAAVNLQAAALPGQKYHVIISVPTMKDTEVYAPKYKDGTELALIRYPHGGTFEIPILKVNNKQKDARKLIGTDPSDGICINSKVAERLSGADFDGDTVMCIPTNDPAGKVRIKNKKNLKGLEGFDAKTEYGPESYAGRKVKLMGEKTMQKEMGVISNLITDMTLAGANDDELARAVRHSMVVIDAKKHKLDYKRSEKENRIDDLKKEYQPKIDKNGNPTYGGAGTLLSRAKGEYAVDKRQGSPHVNIKGTKNYDPSRPEGVLIYKKADDIEYTKAKINSKNKNNPNATIKVSDKGKKYIQFDGDEKWYTINGKTKLENNTRINASKITKTRTQPSTNMAETDDAYTLVSSKRHPMELLYADYANSMKSLARQARISEHNTGKIAYNKTAKSTYSKEVQSLEDKLLTAELNAPKEREATRRARAEVNAKVAANPDLSKADQKKLGTQALNKYRAEVGSVSRKDRSFVITDNEWEAIQAGAISDNKLKRILNNADADGLRERSMPRKGKTLSTAKINQIKAMSASNFTIAEIAERLDVPVSTISNYLKKGAK